MRAIRTSHVEEDVASFLKDQEAARNFWISVWAVDLAYAYGKQWKTAAYKAPGQAAVVAQLQQILDPDRTDIRVALNKIIQNVIKGFSQLQAANITPRIAPAGRHSGEDRDAAEVGAGVHEHLVRNNSGLSRFRQASRGRLVIGDYYLKTCLRFRGATPVVDPQTNQPALDDNKQPLSYQDRDLVWYPVFPGEVTVDFSDPSCNIEDHQIFVHSQVRPLDWIEAHYGKKIESEAKLGQLMSTHELLYSISSGAVGGSPQQFGDSSTPAAVLHEVYMQDPQNPGRWPHWYLLADGAMGGHRHSALQMVAKGPNPFPGLPFLHLQHYGVTGRLYGIGQVRIQISEQDILNHLYSQMLRYTATMCSMPWVVDHAIMHQSTKKQIQSNRFGRIIEVNTQNHPNATMPQIVKPPDLPQTIPLLLQEVKLGMREAAFLSDVSFGRVSARGESAEAIRERSDLSDTVLKSVVDEDEARLAPFILLNLGAAARHFTPARLEAVTNGQFTVRQLMAFQRSDIVDNLSVQIVPGTLLPKTPREQRDENDRAISLQLTTPDEVRFQEFILIGSAPNIMEARAWAAEREECEHMLATGQPIPASPGELHRPRIRMIQYYLNDPQLRWRYPEDRAALLFEHLQWHMQIEATELMVAQELAGMGEMPAEEGAPEEEMAVA